MSEQAIIPVCAGTGSTMVAGVIWKGNHDYDALLQQYRLPTLSLIPVIYNSLGQNKSNELELWPNNEYEIRPYSFQQISSGPTDSDYKIRDGLRFIEWGLAGEGVWRMEMI